MITQDVQVIAVEDGSAWIAPDQKSRCGSCHATDCGIMFLANLIDSHPQSIDVDKNISMHVGDRIVIGIHEAVLLRSALLTYGLPLLLSFIGAAVGEFGIAAGELGTILCCMLGLLSGFLGSWLFSHLYSSKHFSSLVLFDKKAVK